MKFKYLRAAVAFVALALMFAGVGPCRAASNGIIGVNLPPKGSGHSNFSAFEKGLQIYPYDAFSIRKFTHWAGFNGLRITVNHDAMNKTNLDKILQLFHSVNNQGIIVYCEATDYPNPTNHGTGKITGKTTQMVKDWTQINSYLNSYPNIKYELFNEPFGYTDAQSYVNDMENVILGANLPKNRVVLDGLGYATDIGHVYSSIHSLGVDPFGEFSYALHAYAFPGFENQYGSIPKYFSNGLMKELLTVPRGHRLITEFGSNLDNFRNSYFFNRKNTVPISFQLSRRDVYLPLVVADLYRKGVVDQVYIWNGLTITDNYSAYLHPYVARNIVSCMDITKPLCAK